MPKHKIDLTTRLHLLQDIFDAFQNGIQWVYNDPSLYSERLQQAKGFIESVEAADCGSIGGFDAANGMRHDTFYSLYERFQFLCKKHKQTDQIAESCGFTVETLGELFEQLRHLREDFWSQKEEAEETT